MKFKKGKIALTEDEHRLLLAFEANPREAYPANTSYEEGFWAGLLLSEELYNDQKRREDIVLVDEEESQFEKIAGFSHEMISAYNVFMGNPALSPWSELSAEEKNSTISLLHEYFFGDLTPEESHALWLERKTKDGWIYGETKNEEKKTHPCIISYSELPFKEKVKDFIVLFIAKRLYMFI